MTTVPDFMPVLSHGWHLKPSEGACLLEYISVLAGEEFTDRPSCVDPALAMVGRAVNDSMRDEDRHLLVPLIPRLMGTAGHRRVTLELPGDEFARFSELTYRALVSNQYGNWTEARVQALSDLIDEFDKEFGRTTHHELTEPEKELLLTTVNQGASA